MIKLSSFVKAVSEALGLHPCSAGCGRMLGPRDGRWEIRGNKIIPICHAQACGDLMLDVP